MSPIDTLGPGIIALTSSALGMTEILEVVRQDVGFASSVDEPRTFFETETQVVSAVETLWDGQVRRRGEFNDDG